MNQKSSQTIAVTGATGHLGGLVIQALKSKHPLDKIVALVRNPDKATELGVEVRKADYEDPETFRATFAGIDRLLLISSNEIGKRVRQHSNVIEAAKAAGVKHLVYTSILHADTTPLSLGPEHLATEAILKSSGLSYTILRNGWYTENNTASVPGAVASGALIGSAGNGRISGATRDDFAEAAAVVITNEGHEGKTYELAGDTAYTLADLSSEISAQTGKSIPYQNLPQADFAAALKGFGLHGDMADTLAGWDVDASSDALFDGGKQLSKLIGRQTTPLSVAVADSLQ